MNLSKMNSAWPRYGLMVLLLTIGGLLVACVESSVDLKGPAFHVDRFSLVDCHEPGPECRVEIEVSNVGRDAGEGSCFVSSSVDSKGVTATIPSTQSEGSSVFRTEATIRGRTGDINISCSPGIGQ